MKHYSEVTTSLFDAKYYEKVKYIFIHLVDTNTYHFPHHWIILKELHIIRVGLKLQTFLFLFIMTIVYYFFHFLFFYFFIFYCSLVVIIS